MRYLAALLLLFVSTTWAQETVGVRVRWLASTTAEADRYNVFHCDGVCDENSSGWQHVGQYMEVDACETAPSGVEPCPACPMCTGVYRDVVWNIGDYISVRLNAEKADGATSLYSNILVTIRPPDLQKPELNSVISVQR
jgi:hypothetical protein